MLNVVICGTPGTGKSSVVEKLKSILPKEFHYINVSRFAIENKCIEHHDESLGSDVIDEDKLLEMLVPILKKNKFNIIESIHADFLDVNLVSWVYICRTENTKLYDRLNARQYNKTKLDNNLQAEIFQTILDEALECYGESICTQLQNNNEEDLNKNVSIIEEHVKFLFKSVK